MAIRALLVMPRERRLGLLEQLETRDVEVVTACSCGEAGQVLATRPGVQVVLTDTTLPDGDWRSVLDEIARHETVAELVVCARAVDRALWSDVFRRGAYDLLLEPYDSREIARVLSAAAARTYMRSLSPHPPVRAAAAGR